MNTFQSLDDRYLDFTARTKSIFTRFPQIEPLRHFIFRELLVKRKTIGWIDYAKHWIRPLSRRSFTNGAFDPADVLIWVETSRETISGALLPVYLALVSRGIKVRLVSYGGPKNLPSSALRFQFPARALRPVWAEDAWEELCQVFDELRIRPLSQSFFHACSNSQGLLDELNRVLDAIAPKIMLNAATQFFGGSGLAVAARTRGTLTLLLQHGILQPVYIPLLTDYMLTWGESSNETLLRFGAPPERLLALGSPRHDSMGTSGGAEARDTLLRSLSLPNKPTIVFFSNGNDLVRNGSGAVECAEWLEATARKYHDRVNVVVRLHPNENGSLYKHCPSLRITQGTLDLETTLWGCDAVGSICSTVLYEGLLYNKPIWHFHADGWRDLADNWKSGLAERISSQKNLNEVIERLLSTGSGKFIDESSKSHVFANHGQATQAIADFIQNRLN